VSLRLTETQRTLIANLITAELVRRWNAALAAGVHEADLTVSTARRRRAVEAMIPAGTGAVGFERPRTVRLP
jgi:hypothetical protein